MPPQKRTPGPLATKAGVGGGRPPGATGLARRKRAIELKAADARELLRSALSVVLGHMTETQVEQIQRVLDAAVVDPVVEKEAQDLYRRSVTAQIGSQIMRDPAMVRRAERAMKGYIHVTEADKRICLDFKALLAPDALKATTDHPDEAAYLEKVGQILANKGVWLRIGPKLVRDPEDPSRHKIDPRAFNVWLSLGPVGDAIPTETGRLTREALLGTTMLGAGYYREVHQGGAQAALEKEVHRLERQIEDGSAQHQMIAKIRRDTVVGVVEASDTLGGADFPDQSIWDQPHKFLVRALELNVGGNIKGSQAFLVTAAILTRNAAGSLAAYIDESSTGAERAVSVLKVLRTAGEVAEAGLAVTGVVGLVRGGVAVAGEAGAAGARAASVDAAAEKLVKRYVAENPAIAADLGRVRWVPGPRGSVGGGVKPGSSSGAGTGFHKL